MRMLRRLLSETDKHMEAFTCHHMTFIAKIFKIWITKNKGLYILIPLVLDHRLVWNMIIYLAKHLLFFGLSANLRRIISPYTIGNRHSGAGESLIQSCGHNCIEIRSENFDFWLTVSIQLIRMLSGIPISVVVGFSLGGSRKCHILRIYMFYHVSRVTCYEKYCELVKKWFIVY